MIIMYSATFAMTVIIGIAIMHLFLGFSTAILMGYGPKRWSDIRLTIVRRPVSFRQSRPRRSARSTSPGSTGKLQPTSPKQAPARPARRPDVRRAAAPAAGQSPSPVKAPGKIVLRPRAQPNENEIETEPPAKALTQQLDAWRDGESRHETPSMSGIRVELEDSEPDEATRASLSNAIREHIRAQLRKDRRLLKISDNQFAWFSPDVSPDDALMPVERIRQMLNKTRFRRRGTALRMTVVAALVIARKTDDATELLARLGASLQYALSKPEQTTCLDTGQGPESVEAIPVEIEEGECDLE